MLIVGTTNSDVSSILYKLVGDPCTVPWSVVVDVAKQSLVNKEILLKEEITKKVVVSYTTYKYHLNPVKNMDLGNKVLEMDNKMKEFSQKDFYKLLVKSINSGINAQVEKSDTSD